MRYCTEHPIALLIDVIIFLTAFSLLVLVEWKSFQPFKSIGFYCQDPKLRFIRDGETISVFLLLFVSFGVSYFIFLIVERFFKKSEDKIWFRRAHFWYFKYFHGLCLTFLITDLAKLLVGEPRPHFFDTCKPVEAFNCTAGQYFSKYTCSNNLDRKQLIDSFKSFPSGHASFSTYTAIFFVCYFARDIRTRSYLFVQLLQVLSIFWAMLSSFSRITDHRHHWWDVLSGSILGALVAVYFISNLHTKKKKERYEVHKTSKQFNSKLISSEG